MKKLIKKLFKNLIREAEIDAFRKAHADILLTMEDDIKKKSEEFAEQKLERLLSPIDWAKVLTYNAQTKKLYIGGAEVPQERIANLKAEAQFIRDSELWRLIQETPKVEAQRSMFVKGKSLDDMKKGKIMLFTLDQQQNIVNLFR